MAKLKTSACTSVVVERKVSHVVPLFSLFFDRSTIFSGEDDFSVLYVRFLCFDRTFVTYLIYSFSGT